LRNDERQALTTLTTHGIQLTSITDAQKAEWNRVGAQVRQRLTGQIADAALVARVTQYGSH